MPRPPHSVVMEKNRFRFLLSVIRFGDKATRTERRLKDKMAAFREIWVIFIGLCKSLYLVGSAVCIDEQLLSIQRKMWIPSIYVEKPKQVRNQIWFMCDCATKCVMNMKVYLG